MDATRQGAVKIKVGNTTAGGVQRASSKQRRPASCTLDPIRCPAPAPPPSPLFSPTLPTDCGRQAMSCTVMPLGHLRPWDCRRGAQVAGSSGQLAQPQAAYAVMPCP